MYNGNQHLLLNKISWFEERTHTLDLQGCIYDMKNGLWKRFENGKMIALVRSTDPNKPLVGTKKADIETGEDQKGE